GRGRCSSADDDPVWERGELLGAFVGDEEVVLDAQPAALRPVDARLECQHHAGLELAATSLMRVGGLVCARADAVAEGMGGLPRVAHRGDPLTCDAVELRQARSRFTE